MLYPVGVQILVGSLFLLVLYIVLSFFSTPLKRIPGPLLATSTALFRIHLGLSTDSPSIIHDLHKRYGPIVKVGPMYVLVSDPQALRIIYGNSSKLQKADSYQVFTAHHKGQLIQTTFTAQNEVYHKFMRTTVAAKFTSNGIKSLEPAVDQCISLFIKSMNDSAGDVVDFGVWSQFFAGDTAAQTTLGFRFGSMENRTDAGNMIKAIDQGFRYAGLIAQIPGWHQWLLGNHGLMVFLRRFSTFTAPVDWMLNKIDLAIASRDNHNEVGESILSWLRKEQAMNKTYLDNGTFACHCYDFTGSGGTIGISLGAIFYYLVKNPSKYENLLAEISQAENEGQISSTVTYVQTLGMPYLQAVIKEAMRLCPIGGHSLERVAPAGGIELASKFVPQGTVIGVSIQEIHLNPDVFGADPEQFRPERWIEADETSAKWMESCSLGFGKGPRMCLGKAFAMLQMGKFVVQVLRHFDIEWASDKPEWTLKQYWRVEQHGLLIRFNRR